MTGLPQRVQKWRVVVLSSGESTMSKHMEAAGIRSKTGQEIRLLDVPVYRTFGAFDELHGMGEGCDLTTDQGRKAAGAAFAERVHRAAEHHHGHAGLAFVELIAARMASDEGAAELAAAYAATRAAFPSCTGQEARAAARFAVAALAGELASAAGLLPWPRDTARLAMLELFGDWAEFRGRGQSEDLKILRAVSGYIARHAARFASADGQDGAQVQNRAGWWRPHGEGRLYLFTAEAMAEAAQGFDLKRALTCLDKAGAIAERDHDSGGRLNKRVRIAGEGLARVYVINPAVLLAVLEE